MSRHLKPGFLRFIVLLIAVLDSGPICAGGKPTPTRLGMFQPIYLFEELLHSELQPKQGGCPNFR